MNNFKLICVNDKDMAVAFMLMLGGERLVNMPYAALTHDVKVINIRHDFYCGCFLFLLQHLSFEEVPFGSKYPEVIFNPRT